MHSSCNHFDKVEDLSQQARQSSVTHIVHDASITQHHKVAFILHVTSRESVHLRSNEAC